VGLDAALLESTYRRLERQLYSYVYRWIWDGEEALDLIHDAYEQLWRRRDRIRAEQFEALVWTSVINRVRSHQRRVRIIEWLPLPKSLVDTLRPEAHAEALEREQNLKSALEALPPPQREAVLVGLFSGLGTNEQAAMLGVAPGTLASRKHAATARLKNLLKESDHDQ
jgi:RNA polymerase sigma-70 factor, ECF subfamily